MSRDHLPADAPPADDHARAWALIPWLVNGSADAAQRATVERHLAHCADCRAELAAQECLRQELLAEVPGPAAVLDAERGLQRLLGRLDQLPADQDGALAAPSAGADRQPAETAAPAPRRGSRVHAALAAAVVAQAIGLALLSLQLMRSSDEEPYRTLSQPAGASVAAAAAFRIVPDPALPMQQWQALLDEVQLRVVDGPNAAGAYALAPRAEPAAAPAADVLARLRAAPGVRLAEAVGAAP